MKKSYLRFTVAILFCWLALSGMAVGQAGQGSTHIFYIDTSQHLVQWYNYQGVAEWVDTWQDVTAAAGAPAVGVGSGLSSLASNGEHLFYVDSSQHVQHLLNDGTHTSWTRQDLTSLTGSPLAIPGGAVASLRVSSGTLYVIYQALIPYRFGTLHGWAILEETGTTWSYSRFNSGTPLTGMKTIAAYGGTFAHFFYIGSNNDLYEIHWEFSEGWVFGTTDLKVAANASSGIATFADIRGIHVYYGDPSQHVHEDLCPSENGNGVCSGWVDTDLTALTGGILAASTSAITGYDEGPVHGSGGGDPVYNVPGEHVYYVAANGHMNLLLYANNTWTNTDISYVANDVQPPEADAYGGLASSPAFIAPGDTWNADCAYFLESGNYQIDEIYFWSFTQPQWSVTFLNFGIPLGNMPPTAPDSPLTAFVVQ